LHLTNQLQILSLSITKQSKHILFKMQFKSILSIGLLVSSVFAANPVTDALTTIGSGLGALSKDINAWDGDVVSASELLTKAQDLLDVITKSTPSVAGAPAMALTEAVNVLKPANQVVKLTQDTINAMISKKPGFDKAKLSPVVKETIAKFKVAAGSLVDAVQTKLPDNVKAVAGSISKQINAAIEKGLAAYA
jgi:hypothetical protein